MLGTPNGGSPWSRVFDWATVALGLALNHLTAIPWPSSAVGWLAKWMENPTVTLGEMHSNAPILSELNKSADPGIPYVMIAGKTSLIKAANEAPASAPNKPSTFARLVGRLTSPEFLHDVANPFFLGQDNDVAVSVESMENVPQGRAKGFNVCPVACDHLSYFRDAEGLNALAKVLSDAP
jgi:hypothetical protein